MKGGDNMGEISLPLSTCKKIITIETELRVEPAATEKFEKLIISLATEKAKGIQQKCIAANRKTIRIEDFE
jgi:histone H3/H4